jgi:hypothetical protein
VSILFLFRILSMNLFFFLSIICYLWILFWLKVAFLSFLSIVIFMVYTLFSKG